MRAGLFGVGAGRLSFLRPIRGVPIMDYNTALRFTPSQPVPFSHARSTRIELKRFAANGVYGTAMDAPIHDPEFYREQAARCRRLAKLISEVGVQDELLRYAGRLDENAEAAAEPPTR